MATKNLGKVAITPKGEWVAGTYEKLDLVSHQGSSYLSIKDGNTSAVTVVADWLKVAEKGNKGDQGNAGWQPYLVADTTTLAGKTLLKLQDWIGGQGTKPTTNVGQWQTPSGGYTATAANALDLNAVITGNVVNRVTALEFKTKLVYNENIEKIISSVNFDTDIIVSPAHGFVNGDKVTITKNANSVAVENPISLIPGGLKIERYFVVNATADSFQLSSEIGGSVINLTPNPTMDLSKIHVEKLMNNGVQISNLPPAQAYRVLVRLSTTNYGAGLSIRAEGFNHAPRWFGNHNAVMNYTDTIYDSNECYLDVMLQSMGPRKIINVRGMSVKFANATQFTTKNEDKVLVDAFPTNPNNITTVWVTCTAVTFGILNGSSVEIHSV